MGPEELTLVIRGTEGRRTRVTLDPDADVQVKINGILWTIDFGPEGIALRALNQGEHLEFVPGNRSVYVKSVPTRRS